MRLALLSFVAPLLCLPLATAAQAGEPEHGTLLTVAHEGQDYGVQFWSVSGKVVVVSLPEAALREFPASVAQTVAANALAHFNMACSLGSATPFMGLPAAYDVPYHC